MLFIWLKLTSYVSFTFLTWVPENFTYSIHIIVLMDSTGLDHFYLIVSMILLKSTILLFGFYFVLFPFFFSFSASFWINLLFHLYTLLAYYL